MFKSTLAIFILLILLSAKLIAQSEISDSLVHERIQNIQSMLDKSKSNVNIWWYGWLGGYSAATIVQGTVALTSTDKNTRQDMTLGAATTFLGTALQVVTPLNTGKDAEILSKLPEATPLEQLKKLATAEAFLKANAMTEKAGRSWQIHALNESVNLAAGLVTWLAFKRTVWDGVSCFLLNTAKTETQIWTQPTRTLKDYQSYCRKYKSGSSPLSCEPQPEIFLSTFPGGASLRIVF